MEIHRKFFESYFWEKTFVTLVIPRAIAIYQFGRRACNPNLRIWSQVWTYGDHSGNNVLIGTTYIDLYKTKPRTKTRVCGVGGSFFIVQVIRIVARNSGSRLWTFLSMHISAAWQWKTRRAPMRWEDGGEMTVGWRHLCHSWFSSSSKHCRLTGLCRDGMIGPTKESYD